jgi:hypothetical protein
VYHRETAEDEDEDDEVNSEGAIYAEPTERIVVKNGD